MLIDKMNLHKKRIRLLANKEDEKLMFLHFNITAFCSLTDRPTDKIFKE